MVGLMVELVRETQIAIDRNIESSITFIRSIYSHTVITVCTFRIQTRQQITTKSQGYLPLKSIITLSCVVSKRFENPVQNENIC